MDAPLPLDRMTIADKLRVLERIWEDLSRSDLDLPSPKWHEDVLNAREKRLAEGTEPVDDWDQAKKRIRESTS